MWQIEVFEEYIRFTAPDGFKFEFNDFESLLTTLEIFVQDKLYLSNTRHNEKFLIGEYGNMMVIECDPWINKGYETGAVVANKRSLGLAIIQCLRESHGRFNTSSTL